MDYFDEDTQLMLRFREGEESCFEQLVERHKNRVFRLAYRFLGNYQDAEDIAQEVFIKIYRARNAYKPQAKFTTWLYVICKNICLKALCKRKPTPVSIDASLELEEGTIAHQIIDLETPSPLGATLNNEQALVVKKAIDSLPANQKMAVLLYRYDQLSYEEVAKIMSCSLRAVKSLLHRAKINLKERLTAYHKE